MSVQATKVSAGTPGGEYCVIDNSPANQSPAGVAGGHGYDNNPGQVGYGTQSQGTNPIAGANGNIPDAVNSAKNTLQISATPARATQPTVITATIKVKNPA